MIFLPLGLPNSVSLEGLMNPAAACSTEQFSGSLLDLSVDRGASQHLRCAGWLQDFELLSAGWMILHLSRKDTGNIPREFSSEQCGRRMKQHIGRATRRKGRKASPCPTSRSESYLCPPVFIILSLYFICNTTRSEERQLYKELYFTLPGSWGCS